jgi:hypothetical protein
LRVENVYPRGKLREHVTPRGKSSPQEGSKFNSKGGGSSQKGSSLTPRGKSSLKDQSSTLGENEGVNINPESQSSPLEPECTPRGYLMLEKLASGSVN